LARELGLYLTYVKAM